MQTETTAREELKDLTKALKAHPIFGLMENTNQAFKAYYQAKNPEITCFKTFAQWKKEGYSVKKGEKAYKFWSAPINLKELEGSPEVKPYFKIANLFSNLQVQPIAQG